MRLKRLQIQGFKSFSDRISIDFDCDIVGVVGPNGCGKSNIVDAFRWVLGEQSAKSLRGDKMHDVLFAGTDSRAPLNLAEVSVTLTEINGELPLPYDEIMITRRLYRNGDSEYLINKEAVRLKDVQDLFLGSGMGKNTFSVFEQGKLDQVIHLSPLDRRAIFDEAAGIGRFLQRKKETVRRLSQVSENYSRVRDIHQEVEKQTKQLKKQATSAKQFQENKNRLNELERACLLTRWQTLSMKHHEEDIQFKQLSEEIREEQHRLSASLEHIETIKKELKERENASKEGHLKLHRAIAEEKVKEAEAKQQSQKLLELEKKAASLKNEQVSIERKKGTLTSEIEEKRGVLQKALDEKKVSERHLEEEKRVYEGCEKEIAEFRRSLKKARETHLSAIQEVGKLERELQEKKLKLEVASEKLRTKKEDESRLQIESQEKEKEVKSLLKGIEEFKKRGEKEEKERNLFKGEIRDKEEALKKSHNELMALTARRQVLLRLKESCEGFSKGSKELIKQPKFKEKIRTLFEVFKPQIEWMPALHMYAQTLVVTTKKDLEEILAFAQEKELTDFSIMLFDKETFLDNVAFFEDLKEAIKKRKEGVTKEGYYIDHRGVIFHVNTALKEANPFLREAELESLAEAIVKLELEQKEREKELSSLAEKLKEVEERLRGLSEKRRKEEMRHVQENFSLQRTLADLKKTESEIIHLEKELQGFGAIESLTHLLNEKQKVCAALLKEFKVQEDLVEQQEKEVQIALRKWQAAQSAFQKSQNQTLKCEQDFKMLQAQEEHNLRTLKKIAIESKEIEELQLAIKVALESGLHEGKRQKDLLLELEKSIQKEDEELEKCRTKREEIDKHVSEKRNAIGLLEKKQHHFEMVLVEDAALKKGIEEELHTRHHLALEELPLTQIPSSLDLTEAEGELGRLRHSLEKSGPVNMMAIEEYEAQESRYQELGSQLSDLEEAKKDLEKVITKLDAECRKIFKEIFETIRENFKKNFAILFNGGEANLTFTESPDVLEAGIEIVAKPPGKQMRSISLLSGGEKCLTALALLFSIFEVRPAPFCILDEVDAPLDDSNIERFTTVLKQYIEKTQFIIVTHNKKTMAIADLLLGVSMEERGISKLLSLAFEKRVVAI